MAVNSYFHSTENGYASEQDLVERMNIEAIQISGQNYIYIPRTINKLDKIFGEDVLSSFDSYAEIEMYLLDFQGTGGQSEILSKFGMEIQDTASFIVARKRFTEVVVPIVPATRDPKVAWRPNEGDLIYAKHSKSLFVIMFVEDEEPGYYQLNKKYVWTLRTELVQLNNEKFETGYEEVDAYFGTNLNRLDMAFALENGSGNIVLEGPGGYVLLEDYVVSKEYDDARGYGDNDAIKQEFVKIMNFDSKNPFAGT
jgi:hypothetical protein